MSLRLRGFLMASVALALGACAEQPGSTATQAPTAWDGAIKQQVDQQLGQSASRAANALETLAMIQRVRSEPVAAPLDESGLPDALRRPTTVDWSGPSQELVKELAANIGYSYIETGAPQVHEVNVSIHDVPAAKALEDVGLRVQQWATIVVDPNQQRVEYRNEGGAVAAQGAASAPSLHNRHHRPEVNK